MRIIIFSDLHDFATGLHTVTAYAERQNVDRLIYLGDAGDNPALFAALRSREITCIFGNWEVSRLRRLPTNLASWVAAWPAKVDLGEVCYTHATPDVPPQVHTTADAVTYMARGVSWQQLFPRLHTNEDARWSALAALETSAQLAAFHGHTHVQQVWVYVAQHWRTFNGPAEFTLDSGAPEHPTRYLIGVGSAGDPQDGPALRYALYDDTDRSVQLIKQEVH
jgi:predicted phosphodiesterase